MLLTRAPLYRGRSPFSLDLHVLGAPLTFVLSQDQTLQLDLEIRLYPRLEGSPVWLFDAISTQRLESSGML